MLNRTKLLLTALSAVVAAGPAMAQEHHAKKKVVVVTTTLGFRHSSIPTAEKVIGELAEKSGLFTVDYVRQPPHQPQGPKKDATDAEKKTFQEAEKAWKDSMEKALASVPGDYDAIIFANTTGDLPIDREKLLDAIRSGKGFIAMHAGGDTLHGWPGYREMLGGEFQTHHAQTGIDCINCDPKHPATAKLPATWPIKQEEVYLFQNYDPAKVHELLVLDKHPNEKTPGHYPISWCRAYGKGRVFYTALGHREDIWDPTWTDKGRREDPPEVAEAYQKHILGGILWALGLEAGDATPQAKEKAGTASSR